MTWARPHRQRRNETMSSRSTRILVPGLLMALAISAVFAAGAAASPTWRFNGTELSGEPEVTMGFGVKSSLAVSGAPITCEHFLYRMIISNSAGTGKAEVTELPLFNCSTTGTCTVEAIEAEELPWPTHLTTVKKANYVVIKGISIGVLYGGALCPLDEVFVSITGSAGGLFENSSEAAVFSKASFEATGTALNALGSAAWLEGTFPTEAFQWHREQAISV